LIETLSGFVDNSLLPTIKVKLKNIWMLMQQAIDRLHLKPDFAIFFGLEHFAHRENAELAFMERNWTGII
jgi:hypothetical protein